MQISAGQLCCGRMLPRRTVEPLRRAAAAAAEALGALERVTRLQVVPPRLCNGTPCIITTPRAPVRRL